MFLCRIFEREFDEIEAVDSQGGNEGRSITAFFQPILLTGALERRFFSNGRRSSSIT